MRAILVALDSLDSRALGHTNGNSDEQWIVDYFGDHASLTRVIDFILGADNFSVVWKIAGYSSLEALSAGEELSGDRCRDSLHPKPTCAGTERTDRPIISSPTSVRICILFPYTQNKSYYTLFPLMNS